MRIATRIYTTASICCGSSVLKDDVPLGKVYEVDEDSVRDGFTFKCGDCGAVIKGVRVINARDDVDGEFRPLPLVIFEKEH